jgi:hypothetical protein
VLEAWKVRVPGMSFGVREEEGKSMEDLAPAATSLPARRRCFSLIGAKEATGNASFVCRHETTMVC